MKQQYEIYPMVRHISNSSMLQPLASVLAQTLRQAGLDRVVLLARLDRHWKEIVGAQIAAVARPEAMRARVLFVAVADAIWLQQLTFYQAQLLRNIRRVLGDVPIGKLHFTLASPWREALPQAAETRELLPLTAAEERQVVEETVEIADAELRETVRRAWRRGWQVRR